MDSLSKLYYEKYQSYCDKGTTHGYIKNFYQYHFKKYQQRTINILEIGVLYGGSIQLYYDYFPNATIYGLDINIYNPNFAKWCEDKDRVQYIIGDAYSSDERIAELPNIDIFVDDGPHSTESQIIALQKYLPKMNKGGIFVIEDIQDDRAMQLLYEMTPDELKEHTYTLDYRFDSNRYDDRMFVIKLPE